MDRWNCYNSTDIEKHPNGEWVEWEDVEPLTKELEECKAWMKTAKHTNTIEFTCAVTIGDDCTCGLENLLKEN